jgi:hypothetical protein
MLGAETERREKNCIRESERATVMLSHVTFGLAAAVLVGISYVNVVRFSVSHFSSGSERIRREGIFSSSFLRFSPHTCFA